MEASVVLPVGVREGDGVTHPAITELLAAGVLREQCAHCEHGEEFHEDRRCTLCWGYCVYAPAFVQMSDSGGTVKPEPDNQAALLGEYVDVFIGAEDGENVIVSGQLLAFGQGGDFEVLCDDGMVHYCWPLLGIRPQSGSE